MKRLIGSTVLALLSLQAAADSRPNIVFIIADDLGYGDVQCLNPELGKIRTPHLDTLASQGMTFTDAHSGSSVCSPTRYGLLTGRHAWRTRLQNGVLQGFSPPLMTADRLTVPALLKKHGYRTACIGKWHLGMSLPAKAGARFTVADARSGGGKLDPHGRISDGPTACGFDYYFGIAASLDMPPYAFIENDRFTQAPSGSQISGRPGPAVPDFKAVEVLPELTRRAVDYVANAKAPFFLLWSLNSPHTPIVPSPEWQGRSGLGAYGDFVMQTDWSVGKLMEALDNAGMADDTLIFFTSDNGCSPAARVDELEEKGHFPGARLRGYKADIWEGGHRVPFFARWPGKVEAGSQCDQLIGLTDLLATCAEILGTKLPDNAGEDSVSILPVLLGRDTEPIHAAIVHHSVSGRFAIRQGRWKLAFCHGSGGWGMPGDAEAEQQGLPGVQLYDLGADIAESGNLQAEHPEVVGRLTRLMEQYIANGRSTPGGPQTNDTTISLIKDYTPTTKEHP